MKISLCLSDITSAAHAVQIHSIVRTFAFDPLLKLIEGNFTALAKLLDFVIILELLKSINYLDHQLQAKLYQGFDYKQ